MTSHPAQERAALKDSTLRFLGKLQITFPLEQRIAQADPAIRKAYGRVLAQWISGRVPAPDFLLPAELHALCHLDAIVPVSGGLGCYPFSADNRDFAVELSRRPMNAMCAIDALAMSRLTGLASTIKALCAICQAQVRCEVRSDGSLDHDVPQHIRVLWRHRAHPVGPCSDNLCRDLVFLCPECAAPPGSDCLQLPQATAVANAFFGFQRRLIPPASA